MSAPPNDTDLSSLKLLNWYHARLFVLREKLLEHVTLAQKDLEGRISWVEFDVSFHSHMVKVALAIFDKPPLPMAKRALFAFILEVLNLKPVEPFFAQKPTAEKPHGNTTAPNPDPMGWKCKTCGRLFASRKIYSRHTCVARIRKERKTMPISMPNEEHKTPKTMQAQATKQPPPPLPPSQSPPPLSAPHTPPPPPTPPPIAHPIAQTRTLETDKVYAYIITQYCRSCNQKHNIGPFDYEETDPHGTEVFVACPNCGHRLHARVTLYPIDVESTQRDPGY